MPDFTDVKSRGWFYTAMRELPMLVFEIVELGQGVAVSTDPKRTSDVEMRRHKKQAIAEGMIARTEESTLGLTMLICPADWDVDLAVQLVLSTMSLMAGGDDHNASLN